MKTTFRPSEGEEKGIAEIMSAHGANCTAQIVMSWAVSALINHFRKHDRRLVVPISLDETFTVAPAGRATLYGERPAAKKRKGAQSK